MVHHAFKQTQEILHLQGMFNKCPFDLINICTYQFSLFQTAMEGLYQFHRLASLLTLHVKRHYWTLTWPEVNICIVRIRDRESILFFL